MKKVIAETNNGRVEEGTVLLSKEEMIFLKSSSDAELQINVLSNEEDDETKSHTVSGPFLSKLDIRLAPTAGGKFYSVAYEAALTAQHDHDVLVEEAVNKQDEE